MKYRPEIDGLRTIAVVPVILFHAGYSAFQGGYVGVDVFFVISGFLITGILHDDLTAGRYSLLTFYERRARRILPALFFVLAVTLIAGWLILLPEDLEELGRAMAATTVFASNIYFYLNTGYFGAAAELNPLLHTWSLAVEEQFYIIMPVLLAALWGSFRSRIFLVIGSLTGLSFLAAVVMDNVSTSANFYLLPFRAWELGVGALLALRLKIAPPRLSPRVGDALATLGFGMILWAVFFFDEGTAVPGIPALLPVLGTAMILAFAVSDRGLGRFLSVRPMVAIGLLSYSAYLWHQPLFALYRHWRVLTPGPLEYVPLILVTFALAAISWRFVEQPFRNRAFLAQRTVLATSIVALAALGGTGMLLRQEQGFPERRPEFVLAAQVVEGWRDGNTCAFSGKTDRAEIEACYVPGRTVYLFGDSHAASLSKELREVLQGHDVQLIAWTANACMPVPGTRLEHRSQNACVAFKEQSYAFAQEFPGPVILSSRWRLNLTGERFDNGEGGAELGPDEGVFVFEDPLADPALHAADKIVDLAENVPVVVVDQIPEAGWDAYALTVRRQITDPDGPLPSTSLATYRSANAPVEEMLSDLVDKVAIVETAPLICDEATGRCANSLEGVPLYRDDDHPSRLFARMIAEEILDALPRD
ncbi:MAG: acyltransferase family protein [Pseudomonadota bacterium]